jgi:hypothetical protein
MTASALWQGIVAALRADFSLLFAVIAPFTLLVTMVIDLFGPEPPTTLAGFTPRVAVLLLLIPSVIGAFGQLTLTALLATPGMTPRQALARAATAVLPYLAAVLIITPLTLLGLVLLVVPGLYLFGRVMLVGPAVVVEGLRPMAALQRSWALTTSHGGAILWFNALAILFILGASVLASGIGAAVAVVLTAIGLKGVAGFVAALIGALISTLFTMANAAAGVVIYRRVQGDAARLSD